ncbi:hypothetical protein [Aliikangiella sp. G2MR2-5]|uniref:hypothetical protein n=1 Tax=Aliikangiella sp. G2MR2-5 TaxID=2788943 RepID=UPI0018AC0908|nr:hypothetical protein [Aliikangiella sp. G2MR2-5]
MKSKSLLPLVICGKGRIGGPLIRRLADIGLNPVTARLDLEAGLVLNTSTASANECLVNDFDNNKVEVHLLVICISAYGKPWNWGDIFNGLKKQVDAGSLVVENLILVSSTRVFDGIECGMITASTRAKGCSQKAKELLKGELDAFEVACRCYIVRASGLYGQDYKAYWPVLNQAFDRPRFGTSQELLIERLESLCTQYNDTDLASTIELLTDGAVYFRGSKLLFSVSSGEIGKLAENYKILQSSISVIND